MRLFVALDIADPIRERIQQFMEGVRGFAPDVRWVKPESLHITLKFIGEKTPQMAESITSSLRDVRAEPMDIEFRGYGFFPNARAPRVFWVGIEAGPQLNSLAAAVDATLGAIGIPKEDHKFSPHLTLARAGKSATPRRQQGDGPNSKFKRLQDKLGSLSPPEFGTMTAREFSLFRSHLGRGGARYEKLASVQLN